MRYRELSWLGSSGSGIGVAETLNGRAAELVLLLRQRGDGFIGAGDADQFGHFSDAGDVRALHMALHDTRIGIGGGYATEEQVVPLAGQRLRIGEFDDAQLTLGAGAGGNRAI